MNCSDFERLIDAHLDGELAGSVRLEFDAHHLRCARCRQLVAMLESVGNVVAVDRRDEPRLSDDFTVRVMGDVTSVNREPVRSYRGLRIAIAAGVLVQAAAVVMFATMFPVEPSRPRIPITKPPETLDVSQYSHADLAAYITGRVYARVASISDGLSKDVGNVGMWAANLRVSDDVARSSRKLAEVDPLFGLLGALLAADDEQDQPAEGGADNQYSL
ncbi:hypothetical protein RAS1_28580 [Phycisphaerae bacterium RAS1]|nr:hypothetical protein RAS1_28580 [Phycisphaerae bacterium RAS1]